MERCKVLENTSLLMVTLMKASFKIIKSRAMDYMLSLIKRVFKESLFKFIMIDWWLLLLTIICPILLLILSVALIQRYSCVKDEKGPLVWVCKIAVIYNIFLVFTIILILPLDIANSRIDIKNQLNIELL